MLTQSREHGNGLGFGGWSRARTLIGQTIERAAILEKAPQEPRVSTRGVRQREVRAVKKTILEFKGFSPEQMRSIQAEVLITQGDRDGIRPEHEVEMCRLIPHAQLAIFPHADHFLDFHAAREAAIDGGRVLGRELSGARRWTRVAFWREGWPGSAG
jgi:pimeloyl-ACP methyl ester carboxylesterase